MDLNSLINPAQQSQLAHQLSRVLAWGFGVLEIRVEKGALRWLRPGRAIFSPEEKRPGQVAAWSLPQARTLTELLGTWAPAFAGELTGVMGHQFGSLFVGIEFGQIHSIQSVVDLRARTGDTGRLQAPG